MEDGKHHDSSFSLLASFTADNFDTDPSQLFKGEDVDEGLEHAVEEGEKECPVEQHGRFRGVEGSTHKGKAEGRDGDEEEACDANHLDSHTFKLPARKSVLKEVEKSR